MAEGFVKNPALLDENCKVGDLLDFSAQIANLRARMNAITRPSIIALTGPYGIGKSTMLHEMQKQDEKGKAAKTVKWVLFDAWKYPNRKDLWEGFVLDFATQVGKEKEIKQEIDGESPTADKLKTIGKITEKFSGVLAGIIQLFQEVYERSPATRISDIQKILADLINAQTAKRIIFVLEDTDRSGEAGMLFLETLNQFLRRLETSKEIIAIAPVSDEHYKCKTNRARYLKFVDYTAKFNLDGIKIYKFVQKLFNSKLLAIDANNAEGQLISFLESLLARQGITMREIKSFLRECNAVYVSQQKLKLNPDFRATICFEASKYFDALKFSCTEVKFKKHAFPCIVPDDKNIALAFLVSMMQGNSQRSIYKNEHKISPFAHERALLASHAIVLIYNNDQNIPCNIISMNYTTPTTQGEANIGISGFYHRLY